jgi:hypothetical protein
MAFTAKSLSKVTKEKLFEVLGAPRTENVARVDEQPLADGIPPYLVKSATWCGWVNEYDEDFRLLDFGESFVHGKEPEIITQPGGLMPPETVLTEDFDYRVDLWRVGIAVRIKIVIFLRKYTHTIVGRSTLLYSEDSHSTALGTETTSLSR